MAVAFGLQLLLVRFAGLETYGIYVYALSWVSVLVLPAQLGFDRVLIRFVAAYRAMGNWAALSGLLRASAATTFVISVVVGVLATVVAVRCVNSGGKDLLATLMVAFLVVLPLQALNNLRTGALYGLREVSAAEALTDLLPNTLMVLLAPALWLWVTRGSGGQLGAPLLMALKGAAVGAAVILGALWLYRRSPVQTRLSVPEYHYGTWLRVALPQLFIAGQFALLKRADAIMIGALISTDEAGFYAAASRISDLVLFVYVVASGILAPLISELHSGGRSRELQGLIAFAARSIFVATLVAAAVVGLLSGFGLSLFGSEFLVAHPALLILMLGNFLHVIWGLAGFVMSMTGHQTTAAWFGGAAVLMNLALNAALIPRWGMAGAATATAIATTMLHLGMSLYVWRRLGIRTSVALFLTRAMRVSSVGVRS